MRVRASEKTDLTIEEAVAISRQAEAGKLDVNDPRIRRAVGEANQLLVRTQMWGEQPSPQQRRSRRLLATGTVVVTSIWFVGFLMPLLAQAIP